MAKTQLQILRNTVSKIDNEISIVKNIVFCYENPKGSSRTNKLSPKELEVGKSEAYQRLWALENLREYVILQA